MPARNPIPLEGVLNCWNDPYDLPDILLAVSRSGKTGRLSFSNPEGDKTVYMKDGKIIFAESSSDDDGLGQHLLLNGQISLADFTRVSKLVSPGKRLGALLVAEGVLEPKDLVPAVVDQVRAIILGLFRRTESWYRFNEEELPRKESITLDIPFAQLVLDGVQSIDSWRRISKGVGDLDAVFQVAAATEDEWSHLNLESGPTELLTLLNEPMRIADACAQASIDDFDACRLLWGFKALDWIEPAGLSADAAAELAEQAEMTATSSPLPMGPSAPVFVPAPAKPAPDLATTVMHLEPAPPPPIPQRLVNTQVSAASNVPSPEAPRPRKPAAPRPVPANLNHTQLAVDRPEPTPQSQVTTQPAIGSPPKPVPDAHHHTRLFIDAPPEPSPPVATGEMMEAILDGSGDAPIASKELEEPAFPEPRSDSATQFFPGASALGSPPPPDEDFFRASGFDSLSLDYAASPPAELPPAPAEEPSASSFSSFSELAPPTAAPVPPVPPVEEMPLIEATVVEEGAPVPPSLVTTQPSMPVEPNGGPSGLEFFAMNDPLQAGNAPPPPPAPFTTDDPLQYGEASVAAFLPNRANRPKTEELDLDIGHFFNRDERE